MHYEAVDTLQKFSYIYSLQITSLKVEAIIRGGLKRFTDMIGQLWCSLADYYIRAGHFEKARDIYEEAIQTVTTVRDFGQVFDAYAQFEESMINAKMETTAEMGPSEEGKPLIIVIVSMFAYIQLVQVKRVAPNN